MVVEESGHGLQYMLTISQVILLGSSNMETFLKVIVHSKMKVLSSFTLPHIITNLYDFIYSMKHKSGYFEE